MNALAPVEPDTIENVPPGGARWHPMADIFPWIEGPAFQELVEDIRKNGVLEPIVFFDGMILDGRNRYMAAREVGIPYPRVEYRGNDPLGFVIAKNLARRHLTESQRAMVAAKLAKMPAHRPAEDNSANLRTSDAAALLNVSPRTIETARLVERDGAPELIHAVETGKVSVSAAATIAKQDQDTQRRLVAEDKLKRAAAELRKAEADAREAEKLPKAEPLTEEDRAKQMRVFGTQEDRAIGARIDEIIERIAEQPAVAVAVQRIPPAERHAIDIEAIRTAARWLAEFADAWEQEHGNGN